MSTKLIAIVASLALTGTTACVGGDPPSQDVPRPMSDDVPLSAVATPEFPEDKTPQAPEEESPEGCELTVATEGACSIACNPDLVIDTYIPVGTCAMFACELRTGGSLQIGGCHL